MKKKKPNKLTYERVHYKNDNKKKNLQQRRSLYLWRKLLGDCITQALTDNKQNNPKKIWKFHKRKIYQIGTCTKRQCLLKAIALCLKITSFGTQIYKIIYGKDKEKKKKKIYSNLQIHSTNQVIPWPLLDLDVSDTSLKIDFFFGKDWGVIKNYKDCRKEMSNKLLRN